MECRELGEGSLEWPGRLEPTMAMVTPPRDKEEQRGTHVRASLELGGVWRVLVTHSCTAEIETRLQKVLRPMSSDFSW